MVANIKPPKVFISYAWEDDIKPWVRAFAKRLRKDGVETVLDQWETEYGDQLPEFMEKAVRASDFVILICTPKYKKKSDDREGGVGYEGHIITAEIFEKSNHRKFIPVLRKGLWVLAAPSWAAGKLYIDLRANPYSEENYRDLLKALHGKKPTAPPIGAPPDFPDEDDDNSQKQNFFTKFISRLNESFFLFFDKLKQVLPRTKPFFRIAGFTSVAIAVIWYVIQVVPQFIPPIPTAQATATPTQRHIVTRASTTPPVAPTKTSKATITATRTVISAPTVLPNEITDIKDVPMVLVAAGKFIMGSDGEAYYLDVDQQPAHNVFLDAFYIDKYEVTNFSYKVCVDAGVCTKPYNKSSNHRPLYYGNSEFDNYPVIYMDWYQAKAYCEWRGARLPTEAEWEKAAQGTSFSESNHTDASVYTGDTTEVGSYPSGKSVYGAYDMAGNVWEWVNDWYQHDYYSTLGDNAVNPQGPDKGDSKVLRGGSWLPGGYAKGVFNESVYFMYNRYRDFPLRYYFDTGFRCAKGANP